MRARAAASSEPTCCFTLSIYAEEELFLTTPPNTTSGNPVSPPAGGYSYTLTGTAYGLATLRPSDGDTQGVVSTEGGVASGSLDEKSTVTFEGEPFGCGPEHPKGRTESVSFRRAMNNAPSYSPPPGHGDIVANMDFGAPFDDDSLASRCSFAGTAEMASYNLLRAKDPQARFLTSLQGGPIFGSGLSVRGLLRGEHEKNITCVQQAAGKVEESAFTSRVAIVISIVHHSPDDRKRLIHQLRGYVGKMAPEDNAAERLVGKMEQQSEEAEADDRPGPAPAGACS